MEGYIIDGETYSEAKIRKAVLFYSHLEKHKEVQEAEEHKGIPVCKICGLSAEDISNYKLGEESL